MIIALLFFSVSRAHGEIVVKAHLKLRGLHSFEEKFWQLSTPRSGQYAQWLEVDEIKKYISASDAEIAETVTWFRECLGASAVHISKLGDHVAARFDTVPVFSNEERPSPIDFIVTSPIHRMRKEFSKEKAFKRKKNSISTYYTVSAMKAEYSLSDNVTASGFSEQMVWGPGTFGYDETDVKVFKLSEAPLLNMSRIFYDIPSNKGTTGGDNYQEGTLDVEMSTSFGLNVWTSVSNTNTSMSTEESNGFGLALLDFLTELASRDHVPDLLSMSLGSLSAESCDLLCEQITGYDQESCQAYLQTQRQVCMYLSTNQTAKINLALQVLGARGVTILAASGDGGSHFSFEAFDESGSDAALAQALNNVSCQLQLPVFPSSSPYILTVGGTQWVDDSDTSKGTTVWGTGSYGSGSGFSRQFESPAHQQAAVSFYLANVCSLPPADSFNVQGRAYPDVAAFGVDGTSMSTPLLAGIISLLIDHRLANGLPRLGLITPRLYGLYASNSTPLEDPPFVDIATGSTNTSCDNGFVALAGHWDVVSGFGQPYWPGLLKHFGSDDSIFVQ